MSEPLALSTYMIESIKFPTQYVSVGEDDAIVGYKKLTGGIQAWRLSYDSEGLAMFQGVSASNEAEGWIAIREGVLVYTLEGPTGFELVMGVGADLDVFTVKYTSMSPSRGWKLLAEEDGTPVTIVILPDLTGEWRFIRGGSDQVL